MEKILVLLFLLISILPVFYLNKWLQKLVQPRKSFARLMLYFLVVLELVFVYTYLIVLLIAKFFPMQKG